MTTHKPEAPGASGVAPYQVFLLRCWADAPQAWRFSLEEIGGAREKYGFGSLEMLVVFLAERTNLSIHPVDTRKE